MNTRDLIIAGLTIAALASFKFNTRNDPNGQASASPPQQGRQAPPPATPSGPAQQVSITDGDLLLDLPSEDVKILDRKGPTALLQVNMKGHARLHVVASFSGPSQGWSLNIGDSISNDGYGGDAGTNSNDAELQILNGNLDVYGSDMLGNKPPYDGGKHHLKTWPAVTAKGQSVEMEIADGEVTYIHDQQRDTFRHFALFALNGQPDAEAGAPNYDVYIGLNRVVAGGRSGSGLSGLKLTFLP